MSLGQTRAITDICLLVENVERTVEFYTTKLGFKLRRRAEGFADFHSNGITLAAWEHDHISAHTGVSNARSPKGAHKACVAVELDSPDDVDRLYSELSGKGVPFQAPPRDYIWNARCVYFSDPDDTLWELYSWLEGGPGDHHTTHKEN
jgi:catechol 2,3-dioxygenase-like lactoylglutathione lyase family enzyme